MKYFRLRFVFYFNDGPIFLFFFKWLILIICICLRNHIIYDLFPVLGFCCNANHYLLLYVNTNCLSEMRKHLSEHLWARQSITAYHLTATTDVTSSLKLHSLTVHICSLIFFSTICSLFVLSISNCTASQKNYRKYSWKVAPYSAYTLYIYLLLKQTSIISWNTTRLVWIHTAASDC